MWIGPREIRYAVTFGGVLRFVASAGFPFKGRKRWQSEREREPSLSSLLHLRELAQPCSAPAGRPKFLFWLHHFTVCCARGALKRRGGTIHSTLASRALLTSHRPICNPPPLPFVAFMFPGFLIVLLCAVLCSSYSYSLVGFSDEAVHHSQPASSQHGRRCQ